MDSGLLRVLVQQQIISEEKAKAFWKEAQDKKILTKDVMRRINELQEDR